MMDDIGEAIRTALWSTFGRDTVLASLRPLAGDASSRRYYRGALRGDGAPPTVVVMEVPEGASLPLSSEELAIFEGELQELPFLNVHRFLSGIGVRVPRLYGCVDQRWILLEDVGDVCLWQKVQGASAAETEAWYRKAIDALLELQIGGTAAGTDSCIAFQQRFDVRLYMWEFEHFLEYGIEKRPGAPRMSAQAAADVRDIFHAIATRLASASAGLSHRDYHSWNLMVHEEEIVMIDFQDALLAPAQYDLASLLNDRETDRLITSELERRLLDYYIQQRERVEGVPVRSDEFFELYLLSCLQRDLKVVGRFYYLDLVKGKSGYTRHIPPTARRIERNLERLPGLRRLGKLLAEHLETMQ